MIRILNNEKMEKLLRNKLFHVIVWGAILGLNTWTDNLGNLIRFQSIGFRWISSPNYWSFFYLADITRIHHDFVIVKIGHFIGFALFDFLIFNWKQSHKRAFAVSFTFALTTEILQLFFGRDGRLYDVTIDSLGAISVYFLLKYNLLNKLKDIAYSTFTKEG
ncbi:VanZ family protein [Neobacillus pocheonensis]|uniref:VanZ family protein n=1 Tax=Neobacillus pocheonensis TaxID=363869 RepID=A0ABT0WHV0_9BACI|nr:VanZ family protein [Neobacillus pocheonensis]